MPRKSQRRTPSCESVYMMCMFKLKARVDFDCEDFGKLPKLSKPSLNT